MGKWLWMCGVIALVMTGCSRDPDAAVIGGWRTSALSGTITAFKLKEQTPTASANEAMLGGQLMGTAAMEVRKEKTFTLTWLGCVMEGAWNYDPKSREMTLNIARTQGMFNQQSFPPGPWIAQLDRDGKRLRVYPGGRDFVAQAREVKSPLADGIALQRNESM
jgi:hypothetical protein